MHIRHAILISLGSLFCNAHAQQAIAAPQSLSLVQVDVSALSMVDALNQFATQAKLRIVFFTEAVEGLKAPHLVGTYTAEEALKRLLERSGLQYQYKAESRTVEIRSSNVVETSGQRDQIDAREIRLAQAASARTDVVGGRSALPGDRLEEVIVTAQKREQRLQDVPIPVTAMAAQTLAEQNQYRLQDYYSRVPGLSLTSNEFNGTATIAIRGITSGDFINPAVGVTVDDVPFGSSTSVGGGSFAPDLDPSDLAHIEVLRGPQGTLYGASSMGGLVKYVTTDPSTERLGGRVQAGVVNVKHSEEAGYNVNAAVNVPLGDTFAIRASGFTRQDSGYIENIRSAQEGVNKTEVAGGHLSALWRPSTDFSLKLSALFQENKLHGSPFVTVGPGLGDLQQDFIPGTGVVDRKFSAFSATARAQLGIFDLTSVSGYSISQLDDALDFTELFGSLTKVVYPTNQTISFDDTRTGKFSQELRLVTPLGDHVEWLLGGFYTHESSPNTSEYLAVYPDGRQLSPPGEFLVTSWESVYAEWAVFTDLTFRFSDKFEIQVGGRQSQIRQTYEGIDKGLYVPLFEGYDSPFATPRKKLDDTAFTYLVTPQYRLNPGVMVYARLASGYRPGGINIANGLAALGLPTEFKPDETRNYEFGIKGEAFDRRLTFDGSVYYIEWQDIQLSLTDFDSGQQYYINGSAAKSQGVEVAVQFTPVSGLRINGWMAWNDAELTEDFPAGGAYGVSGDRLPYSSRFSGSASLDYEFPVARLTGLVGGTTTYVGDRVGGFKFSPQRQPFPSYVTVDLRAGVKAQAWSLDLYLNNAADKRGIIGGGEGLVPASFSVIQPRTIGLSISRTL